MTSTGSPWASEKVVGIAPVSDGARAFGRAAFDRGCAIFVLVLGSPLVALAAIAVKVSSPGPLLYRAKRAGIGGRPFTMYKLRTMHVGSASGGAITAANDPRTFRVGRLLRRLKVDELPQLYNVVCGQMALVGPRPEDVRIVEEHYTPLMWESLSVLPGMTSAGSLHYFEDEATLPTDPAEAERVYLKELLPAKIAVDIQYVREPTLKHELEILLRTALSVIGVRRPFDRVRTREHREAMRILSEPMLDE